tara:strand:+ start:409 stop:711 length:303 start_codon:yes stop_codon:yes gene_type:complete
MYIAMNRFKIKNGKEDTFEEIWKNRDTHLKKVPGFMDFHLLKGETENDYTLYASHTIWESKNDFVAWTKSEEFRKAHQGAGKHNDIYMSHPKFEGFETVL